MYNSDIHPLSRSDALRWIAALEVHTKIVQGWELFRTLEQTFACLILHLAIYLLVSSFMKSIENQKKVVISFEVRERL